MDKNTLDKYGVMAYRQCVLDLVGQIHSKLLGRDVEAGVEIGAGVGATSALLLSAFPSLSLWMVDPWRPPADDSPWVKTGDRRARLSAGDHHQRMILAAKAVEFAGDRAVLLPMKSQAAAGLRIMMVDFVFIDGDHSYEGVKTDLEAWFPLVRPGGLFCGHDYGHHRYHGVKQAVDEFAAARGLELKFGEPPAQAVWYHWKT